jgi:4-hydroxybenzoate polyprenyltransferase
MPIAVLPPASPTPEPERLDADTPSVPRVRPVRGLLVTLRPRQWVKNLFVAAPVLFSKNLLNHDLLARTALAFVLFCLLSGAVYLINDIVDVEKDRAHPRKQRRPIPSGQLPIVLARRAAVILCVVSIGCAFILGAPFAAAAATYFVLNLAYSFRLKHVVFLDVVSIATFFLLRVVAGSLAIHVEPSYWLLACTALLASLLGFGKRYHELASSGKNAEKQRKVLERYRLDHLSWIMQGLAIATVGAYVMYTLSARTVEFFGTRHMVYTTPFIGVGIFRFQYLVSSRPRAESPTEEMLRDPLFLVNLVLWCAAVIMVIYFYAK